MHVRLGVVFVTVAILAHQESLGQKSDVDREALNSKFWAVIPDGTIVRPCGADSNEARVAMEALQELDERISKLQPGDEHEPIAREILDLLQTPCFLMAISADDAASETIDPRLAPRALLRSRGLREPATTVRGRALPPSGRAAI